MAINALMYAQFLNSGDPATGLSVFVDIDRFSRSTGAREAWQTDLSGTEARNGVYYYWMQNIDLQTYDYLGMFETSGTADQTNLPALWTLYTLGQSEIISRIGTGKIKMTSIVSQSGLVQTVQGDDYYNADSRRIEWQDEDASWPDLTDATVAVNVGGVLEFIGVVVTATGASKKVGLELSAAQSLSIPANTNPGHDYSVRATLTGGHVVTLVATNQPDNADAETAAKWISIEKISVGT